MSDDDPLLKIKAQNKLRALELQTDLDSASEEFWSLMILEAPEDVEITSEEELKSMIEAIKQGTASNNQLTKFIGIANKILNKV